MKHRPDGRGSLSLARGMRREMTLPETILWQELRGRRLGIRFRRQEPVGPFIVDFVCTPRALIVEADGDVHDYAADDDQRDAHLRSRGYRVLRFWNEDIVDCTSHVVAAISAALRDTRLDGRASLTDQHGWIIGGVPYGTLEGA